MQNSIPLEHRVEKQTSANLFISYVDEPTNFRLLRLEDFKQFVGGDPVVVVEGVELPNLRVSHLLQRYPIVVDGVCDWRVELLEFHVPVQADDGVEIGRAHV